MSLKFGFSTNNEMKLDTPILMRRWGLLFYELEVIQTFV